MTKMSVVTRRRARNLQRLSELESEGIQHLSDTDDLLQRGYTLNHDKAMKKKLNACNAEMKVSTEFKGGGNYIIYFSAAMYELYRNALVQHFECLQEDTDRNIRVTSKDSIDCSGSVVESLIKISSRNSYRPKYTINLYHTQSKVMVNGKEAHLFNSEHGIIRDIILTHEDVNRLDRELHTMILEGLNAIEINKSSEPDQNCGAPGGVSEQGHTPPQQPHGAVTDCTDPKLTSESPSNQEDSALCPCCSKEVTTDGILCEKCEMWYHYQCAMLTDDDRKRFKK